MAVGTSAQHIIFYYHDHHEIIKSFTPLSIDITLYNTHYYRSEVTTLMN